MARLLAVTAFILSTIGVMPAAHAELAVNARAPQVMTRGALGGEVFAFNLQRALRDGPVLLYFFPKAFTEGCTLEANAFAEATEEFRQLGVTVVGMSTDPVDALRRFSVSECRSRFAVASAGPAVVRAYDVDLKRDGASTGLATRTSYLITPDRRIRFVHTDMNYRTHVPRALAAAREWRAAR